MNRRASRRKLWDLADCWHCTILGTCLSIKEVAECARRCGARVQGLSDYELHRLAVGQAESNTDPFARQLQKRLERKHQGEIKRFRLATDSEAIRSMWCEQRDAGRLAGALWAVLTHPASDDSVVHSVFGDVHMLSHLAGANANVDRQTIRSQKLQIVQAQQKLADGMAHAARTAQSMEEKVAALQTELTGARARVLQLQDELAVVTSELGQVHKGARLDAHHPAQAASGRAQDLWLIACLAEKISGRQADQLAQQVESLRQENHGLEQSLIRLIEKHTESGQNTASLCGRCVLYLGGKTHQCRHFQAVVEAREGVYLHHDGGLEESSQRITDLISRADAVVCPTQCISHSTMKKARRLCRQQAKPIVFVQRPSLAALADGLEQIVRGVPGASPHHNGEVVA